MTNEFKALVKQSLSIVATATAKDSEIELWMNAGKADLERQGIIVNDISDPLIQSAIVMYVKANFGNVDIKEKELSQRTYNLLCNNLSLSGVYKGVEENA